MRQRETGRTALASAAVKILTHSDFDRSIARDESRKYKI